MSKKAQLSEKHWKAIELIDEGKLTLKEIAGIIGVKPDTLYKLHEGSDAMGKTGQLFKAEISKLSQKNMTRIKDLSRDNKQLSLRMMNDFLRRKMSTGYQSDDDVKLITTVFNALAKATPGVEINSTSYSYVKGLSAEELVHEFNKLRTLAEGASVRGGVPGTGSRISGVLSEPTEPGSGVGEESEGSDL